MCSGFENVDLLWAACGKDNCTDADSTISVRSAQTTQKELCNYNLAVGTSHSSRIRGSRVSCGSVYDATTRPWYQTGIACGQREGTRFGNMCMSDIYDFDSVFYLTFVQPFFDLNNTLLGVLGIDLRLDASGIPGLSDGVMPDVEQKEMTATEHLG